MGKPAETEIEALSVWVNDDCSLYEKDSICIYANNVGADLTKEGARALRDWLNEFLAWKGLS